MFSRVKITETGDTKFSIGEIVEKDNFDAINEEASIKAKADQLILGIGETALTRDSFLSAASFQHTNKILINSAVKGSVDRLSGLKENVIIGRLIPAGTGFKGSQKNEKATQIEEEAIGQFEDAE